MSPPRFQPPAPTPPDRELPLWQWLWQVYRNPILTWPRAVFEQPYVLRQAGRLSAHFMLDPALVKGVLLDHVEAFPKAPIMRRMIEFENGPNILTAEGEYWRMLRRTAAPGFQAKKIAAMGPVFVDAAQRRLQAWQARQGDAPIDLAKEMMFTTLDVIIETMLSGRDEVDTQRLGEAIATYIDTIGRVQPADVLNLPAWAPRPGKRRGTIAGNYIRAETLRIVQNRRARPVERPDLLNLMLEARDPESGHALTDQELVNTIGVFIGAGHETTALALTWALYLIHQHPSTEARLRAEIAEVCGDAPPRPDQADRLVFARQVIEEAMRLYPPVPNIPRIAAQDVNIGEAHIRTGDFVVIPVYAIHRHAKLWHDPWAFNPANFDPELAASRTRYAYLPFGAGPRICIGMGFAMLEAVLILASLIQARRFEIIDPARVEPQQTITLKPRDGIYARVREVARFAAAA